MDITFAVVQESGRDVSRKVLQKGGQTAVPVITVDAEVVVGFNQSLLDSLLSDRTKPASIGSQAKKETG